MTFESGSGSAYSKADMVTNTDFNNADSAAAGLTADLWRPKEREDSPWQKPSVERASLDGIEAMFGGVPVVDSRLAYPPALNPNIFQINEASLATCNDHARTNTQKESLEATKEGDSILNRMYELAILTPNGRTKQESFSSVYGEAAAAKMKEFGITEVTRSGVGITVHLAKQLHFGDASGSIDIGRRVSFNSTPSGGAVTLDRVEGVTASNGMFQLPINRVDLQPRAHGHLSGVVSAGFTTTRVCATPDGKIHR